MSQARPFHFHFPIRQLHPAGLRSVVADLAAGFAGGARAGHLFSTQHQDLLQGLMSDLMDHGLHHLAGVLDQVQEGQQDLPVGLAELLDHRD